MTIQLTLPGVGVSVVGAEQEVLYFWLREVCLQAAATPLSITLDTSILSLQVISSSLITILTSCKQFVSSGAIE